MKNNVLVIILVILIGLLSGIALLLGINSSMQMSIAPINARLGTIESSQKMILQQLTIVQNQLKFLQGKLGNMPRFEPPAAPQEDLDRVYQMDIGSSPIDGAAEAPITIVEFTDLQCPFCARFHPAIKEVLKAYPGQVKAVLKNFPLSFHPNARPAAKLAFAAHEQGKYYPMIDLLLNNGADASEAKAKEYAKELNLNYDQLMKDLKNKDAEYEQRIGADMALAQQVDVQGTPTFFINGRKTGARDLEGYKSEIDQILAGK